MASASSLSSRGGETPIRYAGQYNGETPCDEPAPAVEWPIQQQVALFDSYPLDAGTEPSADIPLAALGATYPAAVGTLPTLPPTGRCLTSRGGARGGAPKHVLRRLPSGMVMDVGDSGLRPATGPARRGPAPVPVSQSPWGSRASVSEHNPSGHVAQTARRPAAAESSAERTGRGGEKSTVRQRPPSLPMLRRDSDMERPRGREMPHSTAAAELASPRRTASGSPPGSARGSRPSSRPGSSASPHTPSLSVHPAMLKKPQPPAAAPPLRKDGWMSRAEHEAAIRRALADLTVQFEAQLRLVRQDAVAMSPSNSMSPAGSPLGSPRVSRPGSAALNTSCEGGRAMPSHRLNHPKWPYVADSRFDKATTPGAADGVLKLPAATTGRAATATGGTMDAPLVVVFGEEDDGAQSTSESPGPRSAGMSTTSQSTTPRRGVGPRRQSPSSRGAAGQQLEMPSSRGRRPSNSHAAIVGLAKGRRGSVAASGKSGRRGTAAPGRRGSRGKASSERSTSATGETNESDMGTPAVAGEIDFQSWNFPSSRRPSGSVGSATNTDTSTVAGRERAWREQLEALMEKKTAADGCYTKLLKLMQKQRSVNAAGSKQDVGTPTGSRRGSFKSGAGTPDSLSASDEDIALPDAASSMDDPGKRKTVAELFTNASATQLTSAIMAAFHKAAAGGRSPVPGHIGSKRSGGIASSPTAGGGGGTERVKTAALKLVDKGRDISERLKRRTTNTEAIAHAVDKYEQQSAKELRAFDKNASARAKKGPAVELKAAVFERQCLGEVLPAAAIPVQCEKDVSSLKGLRGRYVELLGRVATLHEQHLAMVSTAASSAAARRDVIAEYEERARALPKPTKDAADGDGDESGVAANLTASFADASEDRRAANLRAALLSSEATMQPSLGFGSVGGGSAGTGVGGAMGGMSISGAGGGAIGAGHRMHDILGANSRDIGVQNTIEDELLVYRHSRAAALLAKERAVTGAFKSLQTAMANIVAYTENLEVDISCHRCWKVLSDPHVIAPCGITVCAGCLLDTDDGMAADGTTLECGCTEHEGAVPNDTVTGAVEKWADLDRVATDLEYAVKNLGYKVQPCYESRSGTKGIVVDGEPKVKDSKTRLLSAP